MKRIKFNPQPGSHLFHAAAYAVNLAKRERAIVRFSFNGTALVASPKKSPETLIWEFYNERDREAKKPKALAQSRAWAREKAENVRRNQATVARLLARLPNISPTDYDSMMIWARDFAAAADWIGVTYNKGVLAAVLVGDGWVQNQHVGMPPAWFNTRQRMAEYIMGQFLECLSFGMGPHPVTATFVDRYFALAKEAA